MLIFIKHLVLWIIAMICGTIAFLLACLFWFFFPMIFIATIIIGVCLVGAWNGFVNEITKKG